MEDQWRVSLCAFNEGGHDNNSLETAACFTEAQAEAIADLLQFMYENLNASYFTAVKETQ